MLAVSRNISLAINADGGAWAIYWSQAEAWMRHAEVFIRLDPSFTEDAAQVLMLRERIEGGYS
jgi:hypothetical protein